MGFGIFAHFQVILKDQGCPTLLKISSADTPIILPLLNTSGSQKIPQNFKFEPPSVKCPPAIMSTTCLQLYLQGN